MPHSSSVPKYFADTFNDFLKSMAYYSKAISLPIYPALEEQQQEFIILKDGQRCQKVDILLL